MPNAPIKYFGGKGTMFNKIIEHFPSRDVYNTYIEPFGGSFSIGLKNEPVEVEIYNDLDQNVYSLFKVLSSENLFSEFKHRCDLSFYDDNVRNEFKDLLRQDDLSLVDRAFYFFYVNRTSHNGLGGFTMATKWVRRNMCKSVSDFLSSIDRLPELHNRLSTVMVCNMDGVELIKKYNTPNVFFYCDPPYEQSTRTSARYQVDMDMDGHIEFLNAVIETNARVLISGYDCELYDVLEQNGFDKINFDVKTVKGNFTPTTKIETLWKNY